MPTTTLKSTDAKLVKALETEINQYNDRLTKCYRLAAKLKATSPKDYKGLVDVAKAKVVALRKLGGKG